MYMDTRSFTVEKATHIISLGKTCAVAYNLRRYFDFDMAFPFDWWVTPPSGLCKLIQKPDPDYLYNPIMLEVTDDKSSVIHKELKIQLHHEFPREWKSAGMPVRDDWMDYVEKPKARTTALLRRLLALNRPDCRLAFVTHGSMELSLIEALEGLFHDAQWTLLSFNGLDQPRTDWRNDPDVWDRALQVSGLILDRKDHRPFVQKTSEPTYESLINPKHHAEAT